MRVESAIVLLVSMAIGLYLIAPMLELAIRGYIGVLAALPH